MARIRTIKPEFWGHPVLSRAPDEVRLAAIALLNYSDDEGYFLAEPGLVRSFIWPFDEDSSRARRTLENLSRIGYIEVRDHPDHGAIGRVVTFSAHQHVDRGKASKIKGYFDSTNYRRTIVEGSLLEQGTGNREQGMEQPLPTAARSAGEGRQVKTCDRFAEFWDAYPSRPGTSKGKKKDCLKKWTARGLDALADRILADIDVRKRLDKQWKDGYMPDPLTYINQDRWDDGFSLEVPKSNGGAADTAKKKEETAAEKLKAAEAWAANMRAIGAPEADIQAHLERMRARYASQGAQA